jgi:hypothetical protein
MRAGALSARITRVCRRGYETGSRRVASPACRDPLQVQPQGVGDRKHSTAKFSGAMRGVDRRRRTAMMSCTLERKNAVTHSVRWAQATD